MLITPPPSILLMVWGLIGAYFYERILTFCEPKQLTTTGHWAERGEGAAFFHPPPHARQTGRTKRDHPDSRDTGRSTDAYKPPTAMQRCAQNKRPSLLCGSRAFGRDFYTEKIHSYKQPTKISSSFN
jgi:hypothetical protein